MKPVAAVLTLLPLSLAHAGDAADKVALPIAAGEDVIGLLGSLLLMALLLAAGLWFLRRLRSAQGPNRGGVEVVAQIPLGMKEKLLVVQVGEQSLLVGCTPASMQTLHSWPSADSPSLPPTGDFAKLLKGRLTALKPERSDEPR